MNIYIIPLPSTLSRPPPLILSVIRSRLLLQDSALNVFELYFQIVPGRNRSSGQLGGVTGAQTQACTTTMESEMEPSIIKKGRYTYVHDVNKGPPEAIDVHHIIVRRSGAWLLMFCIYVLLGITCFLILLPALDKSVAAGLLSFTIAGLLLRQFQRKQVEKGPTPPGNILQARIACLKVGVRGLQALLGVGRVQRPAATRSDLGPMGGLPRLGGLGSGPPTKPTKPAKPGEPTHGAQVAAGRCTRPTLHFLLLGSGPPTKPTKPAKPGEPTHGAQVAAGRCTRPTPNKACKPRTPTFKHAIRACRMLPGGVEPLTFGIRGNLCHLIPPIGLQLNWCIRWHKLPLIPKALLGVGQCSDPQQLNWWYKVRGSTPPGNILQARIACLKVGVRGLQALLGVGRVQRPAATRSDLGPMGGLPRLGGLGRLGRGPTLLLLGSGPPTKPTKPAKPGEPTHGAQVTAGRCTRPTPNKACRPRTPTFKHAIRACRMLPGGVEPLTFESVIILPAFGVQLETIYRSGSTVRRFVPIGKILKPVLNECVTPVTCYWSLSLILRGEEELSLVFKDLYPPVTMLVPIWKALCATKECTDMHSNCDTR
ncbi:hypothetical protein BUALT_Bualt04G0006800 [Buddleja alternifolia]|uniref:Phosphatidylinositol N-acetylglucosaminyltransferase subunit H conserved domain-containing protein n=1 Tax=Buddleja alternifolia TaxID=168488 RepID=A0AAV6XM50_9LAMI|nr:hypothetical protein BUALT_Bualt04G0006800 [Buddleja alternifolia]